jgi:hypothetical protein
VKNAELSSISDGAENKAELLHGSCQISTTEWAVVVPFSCKSRFLYCTGGCTEVKRSIRDWLGKRTQFRSKVLRLTSFKSPPIVSFTVAKGIGGSALVLHGPGCSNGPQEL